MRDERDDGFPGEIIAFQEGVERHREVAVPVGVAQEDNRIIVRVFDLRRKFRTGVVLQFVIGKLEQLIVRARIFLHGLDRKQVAAHGLLDRLCDILRIADHTAVRRHPACGRNRVHTVGLRNRKIGDQDTAVCGRLRTGAG